MLCAVNDARTSTKAACSKLQAQAQAKTPRGKLTEACRAAPCFPAVADLFAAGR
jgi:hypothetical protein